MAPVQLTVLGANGTYPTPGRPGSGYLVRHGAVIVWMDAGPGTFMALQEHVAADSIDAVIVSHGHPDHCTDLFAFHHAVAFAPVPRHGVPLYAPEDVGRRFAGFLGGTDHGFFRTFDVRPVAAGDTARIGDLQVVFGEADHPVPSVVTRLESEHRTLTYSGDTGAEGDVAKLASDADLFLCEATFQGPEDAKPWAHHLTASEAGRIAREAGARRLMLTHIWPAFDPARSVAEAEVTFGRPVDLAVPGMTMEVR